MNYGPKDDTPIISEGFQALCAIKGKLGTDRAVADFLGYTENYVNSLRKGRKALAKKNSLYIIMMKDKLFEEIEEEERG